MSFKLTLSPPGQCWVFQFRHLLHILYTLWISTLFRGGGGEILLGQCHFMNVYSRLAKNTIPNQVKKGGVYQDLLSRIVRKVAFAKLLPNVVILHFSILVTTKMFKALEF